MIASTDVDTRRIAHIVFRFDYGGLENGVANIVNALSGNPVQHTIIALTEASDFKSRVASSVEFIEIGKRPGKDLGAYVRLFKILRKLRPDVVHTRNIGTLDCAFVAFLARVPIRIHGEHGWDVDDPDGTNRKHRFIRRALSPFVSQFVTVSDEIARWLERTVGLPANKIRHICNGVDTDRFKPGAADVEGYPFAESDERLVVVGSVTRFSVIKDPMNLVEAFVRLKTTQPEKYSGLRLAMIGDGELRIEAVERLANAGLSEEAWLPGSRDDIPELLRVFDIFVLGSYREGISNTILEAMSSGLPVIATDTGGNAELIDDGETGALVAPADKDALANAVAQYANQPELRQVHGSKAREKVLNQLSLKTMVEQYRTMYDRALALEGR